MNNTKSKKQNELYKKLRNIDMPKQKPAFLLAKEKKCTIYFGKDVDTEGTKSYGAFRDIEEFEEVFDMDENNHLYEIVRPNTPCYLVLDQEWKDLDCNPKDIIEAIFLLVAKMFKIYLNEEINMKDCLFVLVSTDVDDEGKGANLKDMPKPSLHLKFKTKKTFRNFREVKKFFGLMMEHAYNPKTEKEKKWAELLFFKKVQKRVTYEKYPVCDPAIYSANRNFRMLGQSKKGKQTTLKPWKRLTPLQNNWKDHLIGYYDKEEPEYFDLIDDHHEKGWKPYQHAHKVRTSDGKRSVTTARKTSREAQEWCIDPLGTEPLVEFKDSEDKAEQIRFYLSCIPDQDRDCWVKLGMICKHELDEEGKELWFEYSEIWEDEENHPEWNVVWESFDDCAKPLTISTLRWLAMQTHPELFCDTPITNEECPFDAPKKRKAPELENDSVKKQKADSDDEDILFEDLDDPEDMPQRPLWYDFKYRLPEKINLVKGMSPQSWFDATYVAKFNEYFCCIKQAKAIVEVGDDNSIKLQKRAGFKEEFENCEVTFVKKVAAGVDSDGKQLFEEKYETISYGDLFLKSKERKSFQKIEFDPNPKFAEDPLKKYTYNLFRGWPLRPVEKVDLALIEPILSHIREVYATGDFGKYRRILAYYADVFRNPHQPPGIGLALCSKPGAGKDQIHETLMKALFGNYWSSVNDIEKLSEKFNIQYAGKLFIKISEMNAGGYKNSQKLKSMITDKWQVFEDKYQTAMLIENYARYVFHTNFEDSIHLDKYDRRFLCLDISNDKIGDRAYFAKLSATIADPMACRHFFTYLIRDFDMEGIDLRQIPETKWRTNLIEMNLQSFDKFWVDVCDKGIEGSYSFGGTKSNTTMSYKIKYYELDEMTEKSQPETFNIPSEVVYNEFQWWLKTNDRRDKANWTVKRFYANMREMLEFTEKKWPQRDVLLAKNKTESKRCMPLPKPSILRAKLFK